MNEEVNLSSDELDALMGDTDLSLDVKGQEDTSDLSSHEDVNVRKLQEILKNASKSLKHTLSEVLGEEVALTLDIVEDSKGVSLEGSSEWYIATGSFSNNGHCDHAYIFPSEVAHRMAIQYSGMEDLENQIDQVNPPLTELSQNFMNSMAQSFGTNFNGEVGIYEFLTDYSKVLSGRSLIKVKWNLGENSFFEFFSTDILQMLSTKTPNKSESSSVLSDGMGNDDTTNDLSTLNDKGISSLFGLGEDDGDPMSLGDTLLGTQSVSNVSLPSFDEESGGTSSQQLANNPMNMLMDVTMDVTVELGSTRKLIGEILDLNRGSIIELKKLAGEPLDIKINNKLIARGEVVIIDEYFGVRVIEIVSPREKANVT